MASLFPWGVALFPARAREFGRKVVQPAGNAATRIFPEGCYGELHQQNVAGVEPERMMHYTGRILPKNVW